MVQGAGNLLGDVAHVDQTPFLGTVDIEYQRLGCFPRYKDDMDAITGLRDVRCANHLAGEPGVPCRSGLPFYRLLVEKDAGPGACFRFCTSKGLDLFGLTGGGIECRCGASEANAAVWRYKNEEQGFEALQLDTGLHSGDVDRAAVGAACGGIEVFRYVGWMEQSAAGGVPWLLMEASPTDVAYIDGIVHGTQEILNATEVSDASGLINNPKAEHGAGKLWPQIYGVVGIRVFYEFAEDVGPEAIDAFDRARKEWSFKTANCVRFVEASGAQKDRARLFVDTVEGCGPDAPGFPGQGEARRFDLGACSTERDLGRLAHELGVVLGITSPWAGQGGLGREAAATALMEYPCHGERDSARSFFQRDHSMHDTA